MPPEAEHAVHCRLDDLLAERGMTLATLSERVGVSVANLVDAPARQAPKLPPARSGGRSSQFPSTARPRPGRSVCVSTS